jgi:hypothetical protein
MATKAEKEKLMEVLKFTPRTYKIQMWGYGGEKVMGTVDRKIYDYFKSRRIDLMDYCWDSDYASDNNIPEEMQPFPLSITMQLKTPTTFPFKGTESLLLPLQKLTYKETLFR